MRYETLKILLPVAVSQRPQISVYCLCHVCLSCQRKSRKWSVPRFETDGKVNVPRWRTENVNVSVLDATCLRASHYLYVACLSSNLHAEIAIVTRGKMETAICNEVSKRFPYSLVAAIIVINPSDGIFDSFRSITRIDGI